MAEYYNCLSTLQQRAVHVGGAATVDPGAPALSEFKKLCESLLTDDMEEGWASELRRYLSTMQRDVT